MTPPTNAVLNRLPSLLAIPAVIGLDLATKAWARTALVEGVPIELAPFFNLALHFNRGVAFGLLNASGMGLIAAVTVAVTIFFALWWWRESNPISRFGLGMILGGALANLADRLQRGAVTDFLDLHAGALHWPTFNLADAALTLGVIILLAAGARKSKTSGDGHADEPG